MFKTVLVGTAAALALTQTAAAQAPAAASPAPGAPAAPAASAPVGDQDLKAFARVLIDIEKLRTAPG
ncbi:MAG: hypothetical protein JWO33_1630, partial [Caulobacteraceae bacterium]|nr:hypothetical protein [Caulobacteraceae bacterium]